MTTGIGTHVQREKDVKLKKSKPGPSVSAHRRKESKEPTCIENGPAKCSRNENIRTDRQTETDRQTDGRTEERRDGRTDGWTDERTDRHTIRIE